MLAAHLTRFARQRPDRRLAAMDPAHLEAIRNYLALATRAYGLPQIYRNARPQIDSQMGGMAEHFHQMMQGLLGEHDPMGLLQGMDLHEDVTGQRALNPAVARMWADPSLGNIRPGQYGADRLHPVLSLLYGVLQGHTQEDPQQFRSQRLLAPDTLGLVRGMHSETGNLRNSVQALRSASPHNGRLYEMQRLSQQLGSEDDDYRHPNPVGGALHFHDQATLIPDTPGWEVLRHDSHTGLLDLMRHLAGTSSR